MTFDLFTFWYGEICFGFEVMSIDTYREDEMRYALIGFCYCKDDKILQVDFLWRCFEFNLNRN